MPCASPAGPSPLSPVEAAPAVTPLQRGQSGFREDSDPPGPRSWELAGLGFSGFQPRPVRHQEPSCGELVAWGRQRTQGAVAFPRASPLRQTPAPTTAPSGGSLHAPLGLWLAGAVVSGRGCPWEVWVEGKSVGLRLPPLGASVSSSVKWGRQGLEGRGSRLGKDGRRGAPRSCGRTGPHAAPARAGPRWHRPLAVELGRELSSAADGFAVAVAGFPGVPGAPERQGWLSA